MKSDAPPPLALLLSGELGEIVADRIAGVAPEQQMDVAWRTIIEVLRDRPEVVLKGPLRLHVADALEQWFFKKEYEKLEGHRLLKGIKTVGDLAKGGRKNKKAWEALKAAAKKAGMPEPPRSALEVTPRYFGFSSDAMLKQFVRRLKLRLRRPPRS